MVDHAPDDLQQTEQERTNTSDQLLVEAVETALRADPSLHTDRIQVSAINGVIYLRGHTSSPWQIATIDQCVKQVAGVEPVINLLRSSTQGHESLTWSSPLLFRRRATVGPRLHLGHRTWRDERPPVALDDLIASARAEAIAADEREQERRVAENRRLAHERGRFLRETADPSTWLDIHVPLAWRLLDAKSGQWLEEGRRAVREGYFVEASERFYRYVQGRGEQYLDRYRQAVFGEATAYQPDKAEPPVTNIEDWERAMRYRWWLWVKLKSVAERRRNGDDEQRLGDYYSLAFVVGWRPHRKNADDRAARDVLEERVRNFRAAEEVRYHGQVPMSAWTSEERVRDDVLIEAVSLVLGQWNRKQRYRFGARGKTVTIIPRELRWLDCWDWFNAEVQKAARAILLEKPYPSPRITEGRIIREPFEAGKVQPHRHTQVTEMPGAEMLDPAEVYLSSEIENAALRAMLEHATPRALELLALLDEGYTQADAADALGVTHSTVRVMLHKLRRPA